MAKKKTLSQIGKSIRPSLFIITVLVIIFLCMVFYIPIMFHKTKAMQNKTNPVVTKLTPNPSNTIDNAISYDIPPEFKKTYDPDTNMITLSSPDFKLGAGEKDMFIASGEQITINQYQKVANYSVATFLKGPLDPRIQNVKETTIGGYDAVSSETNTFTDTYTYQVVKNNYMYVIAISLPVKNSLSSNNINPFLKKFQLINDAFINSVYFK